MEGLEPCSSCMKQDDWDDPDYENFRPLDVHKWSKYMELNALVSFLHAEYFKDRKAAITRKHLKVLLLDLYVRWIEHPDGFLAVSLNHSDYRLRADTMSFTFRRKRLMS